MPCYNCTQKIPGVLFIVKLDESFAVYFTKSRERSFQRCNYFINFQLKIIPVFFCI